MKNIKDFLALLTISASFLLMGCTNEASQNGTPALFDSKAEAEKAAKNFNCTGSHQMGDKWMPCNAHQENKKQGSHGHHHH